MIHFHKHFFVLVLQLALASALTHAQSQGARQLVMPLALGVLAFQGKNRLLSPAASRDDIQVDSYESMWTNGQAFLQEGRDDDNDHDVELPDEDDENEPTPRIYGRIQGLTINIQGESIVYQRNGQSVTEAGSALERVMQRYHLQKIEISPASFTLSLYPADHDPKSPVNIIIPSITEPVNPACGEWAGVDVSLMGFVTYDSMDEIAAIAEAAMRRQSSDDYELTESDKEEKGEHSYVDALANSSEGYLFTAEWFPPVFPESCMFEKRQDNETARIELEYGFESIRLNDNKEENGSLSYKFEHYIKVNNNGSKDGEEENTSSSDSSDSESDSDSYSSSYSSSDSGSDLSRAEEKGEKEGSSSGVKWANSRKKYKESSHPESLHFHSQNAETLQNINSRLSMETDQVSVKRQKIKKKIKKIKKRTPVEMKVGQPFKQEYETEDEFRQEYRRRVCYLKDNGLYEEKRGSKDEYLYDANEQRRLEKAKQNLDDYLSGKKTPTAVMRFSDRVCIGKGIFGTVYRAKCVNDCLVALKEVKVVSIPGMPDEEEELKEHIENEKACLQYASSFLHDNIIKYFGSFKEDQSHFFVFELADQSVHSFVSKNLHHVEAGHINTIASQMVEIFNFLEKIKLEYRDFKLDNLVICSHGTKIKLIDFTSCQVLSEIDSQHNRQYLVFLGKQLFMVQTYIKRNSFDVDFDHINIRKEFDKEHPNPDAQRLVENGNNWLENLASGSKAFIAFSVCQDSKLLSLTFNKANFLPFKPLEM